MDPRIVNKISKKHNGYFITPRSNAVDHDIYNGAVHITAKLLFEQKIRSNNILTSLSGLETVAASVQKYIEEERTKNSVSCEGSMALAWMIVLACVGAYNEKQKIKEAKLLRAANNGMATNNGI
jgi:hypothetical protein